MLLLAAVSTATAGSLGGPLDMQDFGSFFVGGRPLQSTHPGPGPTGPVPAGQIRTGQMYVQYLIPKTVSGPAIVMVPGAVHTGAAYETTPDGREGWGPICPQGFPVYVVDHAGRARSGFDPTPVNRARAQGNAAALPEFLIATRELAWFSSASGRRIRRRIPARIPPRCARPYFSQLVPNTESTLPGAGANTVAGLAALLDKIGPAVVLVHSQSGAYGIDLVRNPRPNLRLRQRRRQLRAGPPDEIAALQEGPDAGGVGRLQRRRARPNGDLGVTVRRHLEALQTAGGAAKYLLLPEAGQKGNSHMLMLDKNNLAIADLIIRWIGETGDVTAAFLGVSPLVVTRASG